MGIDIDIALGILLAVAIVEVVRRWGGQSVYAPPQSMPLSTWGTWVFGVLFSFGIFAGIPLFALVGGMAFMLPLTLVGVDREVALAFAAIGAIGGAFWWLFLGIRKFEHWLYKKLRVIV